MKCIVAGAKYDLDTSDELPSLSIAMFHKGAYSVSEQPLGVLTVNLDTIDGSGQVYEGPFSLEPVGRMKTVSGQVHISFSVLLQVTHLSIATNTGVFEDQLFSKSHRSCGG